MPLWGRQNLLFDPSVTAVAVVTDSVGVIPVGSQVFVTGLLLKLAAGDTAASAG